jgi:phenylacetate-coenzyme A ligase PaaK-like adenylate-forming protein
VEELGLRAEIEIVAPGTLERSVGKAKRVLDERGLS